MSKITFILWITFLSLNVSAGIAPPLNNAERASLRFHLESLYNELDLLRKNQRADLSDVKRQEQAFEQLKVFERIPFKENIQGLKSELTQTAKEDHLKLVHFKITGRSRPGVIVPKKVFTDSHEFRFSTDQLVEEIYFEAVVNGSKADVQKWIKKWNDNQLRLTELTKAPEQSIKSIGSHKWQIEARAFRFREVQFPTLVPRNPRELLPNWAQKDPNVFAHSEPALWKFVTKIENLIPNSEPYYKARSRFFLNDARMRFFLAHAQ